MRLEHLEIYDCVKFQYLLIHKSGCSYVMSHVRSSCDKLENIVRNTRNYKTKLYTTIRDPFERFVSGLSYDLDRYENLYQQPVDTIVKRIKSIDPAALVDNDIDIYRGRSQGDALHTISQRYYIQLTYIDYAIWMKDITSFCKLYFPAGCQAPHHNSQDPGHKQLTEKIILADANLKKRIDDVLFDDYHLIEQLNNNNKIWRPDQDGKLPDVE